MKNKKNYITNIFLIIVLSFISLNSLIGSDKKSYENFSLYDYNQKEFELSDFTSKKGIVVMFIATKCPVSNAYNERMEKLYKKFGEDFSFVGINSNKAEDINEIKDHAAENNLTFVILKDSNNVIADKFEASFTPEIFVLGNNLDQLYHGRIDDSRKEENIEIKDLENALLEIKSGKSVSVSKTKAFGCSIKRIEK